MAPTEDSQCWLRGVGFGLALSLCALLLALGVARWKGSLAESMLIEPLVLMLGMQTFALGAEFRMAGKNSLGKICLVMGVVLFGQGLFLLVAL